jgi:16S rRNA A1518/A1519 N6-dimethyltransferase RsmA/KsgA/DIM1 with predicted DNA glycosylase/AP lyase activity
MQIDFTLEQLAIVDKAIQQLPYYIAAPLIAEINKQIAAQNKEAEE